MTQPDSTITAPPAPGTSVFSPQPPGPPAAAPAPPAEPPVDHDAAAAYYTALGRQHGIQGRLDVLGRRLTDLLDGHAALVSHITDQAPAASASTPGGTAFWGQVLDQHRYIHGLLEAAKTDAASLLAAHAGAVEELASLL